MKLLKEEDMNRMLKGMLAKEETLRCNLCGMISVDDANMLKLKQDEKIDSVAGSVGKGFKKRYCFIGVTENRIIASILNPFDSTRANNRIRIPLDAISSIEVTQCLLSKNNHVKITLQGNMIIDFVIISSAISCGVAGQKENAAEFFRILAEL
ncbi:MAG: hypothetical protein PHP54_02135 [Clostridia bacterium]|nr:hypothetical protein [Clostridia bacterium]